MESYPRRRYAELEQLRAAGDLALLPRPLTGCDELLAHANDADVTYFRQFIVLKRKADAGKPAFATLPGWYLPAKDEQLRAAIEHRVERVTDVLRPRFPRPGGAGPDPVPDHDVDPPRAELSFTDIYTALQPSILERAVPRRMLGRSERRSASAPAYLALKPGLIPELSDLVEAVIDFLATTPGALRFDARSAVWAVGAEYEQLWASEGYRRGRLVRSLPLTPGEEIEIQIKSWDRRTARKNVVESVERGLSTEVTGEEKWSLATKMNFVNQTNASVNPSAGASGDVTIPVDQIPVKLGGNLGLTGTLANTLTQTTDTAIDYVQSSVSKAAHSLKETRTSTIELAHEVGTETATKQLIKNSNRCHTVTYHYFEVVEDFRVTTQVSDAALFLLLPLPVPIITIDWVLCHECLLRSVLLCPEYYAGFEAAKRLRLDELIPPPPEPPGRDRGGSGGAGGTSGSESYYDGVVQPVLSRYRTLRDAGLIPVPDTDGGDLFSGITNGAGSVTGAIEDFAEGVGDKIEEGVEAAQEFVDDTVEAIGDGLEEVGEAIAGWAQALNPAPQARMAFMLSPGGPAGGPGSWLYWRLAETAAPQLGDALRYLEAAWPDARGDFRAEQQVLDFFFGKLGDPATTLARVDAAAALLAAGAVSAGAAAGGTGGAVVGGVVGGVVGAVAGAGIGSIPGWAVGAGIGVGVGGGAGALIGAGTVSAVLAVVSALEPLGLVDTVPDDEGLRPAIFALKAELDAVRGLGPQGPLGAIGPGAGAGEDVAYAREEFERWRYEHNEAVVEYERLACHLGEHLVFYAQAIWTRYPDYRVALVAAAAGVPPGVVENRLSGFVGALGALKVRDLEWLERETGIDWEEESRRVVETDGTPPELFTLPTGGMVVEPALGRCDACEPFIHDHRALDLDFRSAEVDHAAARARQAELEVDRFQARLDEGILDDPTPLEPAAAGVEDDEA